VVVKLAYSNALIASIENDLGASRRRNSQWGSLVDELMQYGRGNPSSTPGSTGGQGLSQTSHTVGKVSGNVDNWIAQAYKALGIPLTSSALKKERYLIQHESGGNPRAQNNWDSNAKKGIPSKGLAQTIDPTFRAYALKGLQGATPGTGDIWDPVENLVASLRYRKSRYGNYDIGYYKGGY
jgi:Transglycosylase SLT domain